MNYKDVAMLTRLRVEMPQMTKIDKKATEDAEMANHAHGAGKYRKDLYPKHLIDPIVQVASAARAYMYSQTRQCAYSGQFYLPNRRIMVYLDTMSKYELAFWQAVTAFLNNWSNVMLQAQQQQGLLFDPTVYPDTTALKAQFVFEYPLAPVPDTDASDTILRELNADMADVVMAKVRKDTAAQTEATLRSMVADLKVQVARIAKQTSVTATKNKAGEMVERSGKIYDSLTQEIKDLTDLMADLDFGGSQALADVAADIDMHLSIPAESLRTDTDLCKIVSKKATDILAQMEAFL